MTKTPEEKEAAKLAKEQAKAEKAASKKITSFADIDSSAMVNIVKAERAFRAVFGGSKSGTNELVLVQRLAGEYPDKEELVTEVYKGLGGLLDVSKAEVNRANERKATERKAKV